MIFQKNGQREGSYITGKAIPAWVLADSLKLNLGGRSAGHAGREQFLSVSRSSPVVVHCFYNLSEEAVDLANFRNFLGLKSSPHPTHFLKEMFNSKEPATHSLPGDSRVVIGYFF